MNDLGDDNRYRALYEAGVLILTGAGIAEAALDARLLLEYVCHTTHETLLADGERPVTVKERAEYERLIEKRAMRTPVAYITGQQAFMGLAFSVTKDVLIPNQDTEILAEEALRYLHDGFRILDLCTGSGCVGLSLLHYSNDTTLIATDISEGALRIAEANARALGLRDRCTFLKTDLYPEEAIEKADLAVANPPYIPTEVIATLESEVRDFEPRIALDGGADGLTIYRRILKDIGSFLNRNGGLLVEIGFDQADAVTALFQKAGMKDVQVTKDLAGHDRVVAGIYAGE